MENWRETRKALYRFLLLNPDEFAAKCMLEQAALIASQRSPRELNWHDVDFGLVRKLYEVSDESKQIIRRLMLGDVYGCLCILSTSDASVYDRLSPIEERSALENALSQAVRARQRSLKSASIALHIVEDAGRSERQVVFRTPRGPLESFGRASERVLLGIFFRNSSLSAHRLDRDRMIELGVQSTAVKVLAEQLKLDDLSAVSLYAEAESLDATTS
jgi:hypothetical protein